MFKNNIILKVPKCENFELAFFTVSDTIWIVDLRTEPKYEFITVSCVNTVFGTLIAIRLKNDKI
jgi:hypothetical protein